MWEGRLAPMWEGRLAPMWEGRLAPMWEGHSCPDAGPDRDRNVAPTGKT
jgi:hypothetical protein